MQICGVVSVQDCELALERGADLIGMIMWPRAKRSVPADVAAAICAHAHGRGARVVGVFVDEDADAIAQCARQAGLDLVQLHGNGARSSLHSLPEELPAIYVLQATPEGAIQTQLPSEGPSANGSHRKVCRPAAGTVKHPAVDVRMPAVHVRVRCRS